MHITKSVPDLGVATEIAASGFCQSVSPELERDVATHLAGGDLVYTFHECEQVVGFAIFNVWENVLYLGGIILDAQHQGRRMVQQVVARAIYNLRNEHRVDVDYLAFRTQSLRMWVAGARECEQIFPCRGNHEVPEDIMSTVQMVASRVGSDFPVGVGCYGNSLYGQKPVYGNILDRRLRRWWDEICDFERGDAVLCVGHLPVIEWVDTGW